MMSYMMLLGNVRMLTLVLKYISESNQITHNMGWLELTIPAID